LKTAWKNTASTNPDQVKTAKMNVDIRNDVYRDKVKVDKQKAAKVVCGANDGMM
jgi:hypothetical protein